MASGNVPQDVITNAGRGSYVIGKAAATKIAFHGVTPVARRSGAAQAAVATTAATNSSPYGYSQAQADAIIALLNEIRATLVAKGLMKGSA